MRTMIQLLSAGQLSKATEITRKGHLFVQATGLSRQYKGTNRDTVILYVVDFFLRDGKRFGHCTCKGGLNNQACKHLSAAVTLHGSLAAILYYQAPMLH